MVGCPGRQAISYIQSGYSPAPFCLDLHCKQSPPQAGQLLATWWQQAQEPWSSQLFQVYSLPDLSFYQPKHPLGNEDGVKTSMLKKKRKVEGEPTEGMSWGSRVFRPQTLAFHCLLTLNICPTFKKINVAFDDSQCYLRIKIALLQCSTLKSSAFAKLQTDATQVPANDLPSPISKGRFQNMWKSLGHVLFLQWIGARSVSRSRWVLLCL